MAKLKSSTRGGKAGRAKSTPKPQHAGIGELRGKAEEISHSIVESAQQIWLAGMGAFARAQDEGTRLFEALVKEGMSMEKATRHLASGRVNQVRDAVEDRVEQARERAADTWDRLEKVFEQRVQRALNRLGVPGREELLALIERVDALTLELRKLGGRPAPAGGARSKPAGKGAAAKPAGKKASRPASASDSKKADAPASNPLSQKI